MGLNNKIERLMVKDNYNAKFEIWSKERQVIPDRKVELPIHFGHKVFSSYEEFYNWKKSNIELIARKGGVKWKE